MARGSRVPPLDEDAVRAVGEGRTTLAAHRTRVTKAYGDKLPGPSYAKGGKADGYAERSSAGAGGPLGARMRAAAGALAVGGLGVFAVRRARRGRASV